MTDYRLLGQKPLIPEKDTQKVLLITAAPLGTVS